MPNGLSGGFVIERDRLREILERVPRSVRASWIVESTSTPGEVADRRRSNRTAGELLEVLESFPGDQLVVQQHDGVDYVIRFDMRRSENPDLESPQQAGGLELWHTIAADSPIFQDIVDEHRLWLTRMAGLG